MDFSDLAKKHCIPCKTGEGKLPISKIKEYLALIPEWMLIGETIVREFKFDNFKQAIGYINNVAEVAESENDFILAAKINQLKLSS